MHKAAVAAALDVDNHCRGKWVRGREGESLNVAQSSQPCNLPSSVAHDWERSALFDSGALAGSSWNKKNKVDVKMEVLVMGVVHDDAHYLQWGEHFFVDELQQSALQFNRKPWYALLINFPPASNFNW